MRALSAQEIVVELLSTYRDVAGAGERGEGSDRADDRLLLMSPLYHEGTYAELERCLHVLRCRERALHWHVAERYLRSTRRVTLGCPGCGRPTPEGAQHSHHDGLRTRRFERGRIVELRWHPHVDLRKVDAGVDWLVREHRGTPYLPREIFLLVAS